MHISDLHYNKIGTQTEAMRDKLPDYIKEIVQERNIDYVFFTGDARYAPDKDFPDGIKRYFSDICEAAHIDQDRLFIVMGMMNSYIPPSEIKLQHNFEQRSKP